MFYRIYTHVIKNPLKHLRISPCLSKVTVCRPVTSLKILHRNFPEHLERIPMAASVKNKSNNFTFPHYSLYFLDNKGPVWIKFCQVLLLYCSCRQISVLEDFVVLILMTDAYLSRQI